MIFVLGPPASPLAPVERNQLSWSNDQNFKLRFPIKVVLDAGSPDESGLRSQNDDAHIPVQGMIHR
jgi:hypothetical protein